jgi:hypothetical protein
VEERMKIQDENTIERIKNFLMKERKKYDERTVKLNNMISNREINNTILNEYDNLRIFRYNFLVEVFRNEVEGEINEQYWLGVYERYNSLINNECKLWRVDSKVQNLLLNTDSSKIDFELKLPFNKMFVDNSISIGNFNMYGIYLSFIDKEQLERTLIKMVDYKKFPITAVKPIKASNCVGITTIGIKNEGKKSYTLTWEGLLDLESCKINSEERISKNITIEEDKLIEKVLTNYILNLLLFLNEPRVTYYTQESTNNEKKFKKGLIPIPSLLKTRIEYTFEQQIESIYFNSLGQSKLGYAYEVRGHWRRFLSSFYINKQGQKLWILPHIRGQGILVPQVFEVVKSD